MKIKLGVSVLMAASLLMPLAASAQNPAPDQNGQKAARKAAQSADKRQIASKAVAPVMLDIDLDILNEVRQALLLNDNLSPQARNIRITSNDGDVTLHGAVASMAEKNLVDSIVKGCAGVFNVSDYLQLSEQK